MARILLVDDDKGALATTRRALEMDGHTIATCEDGADALGVLRSGQAFDALVTDMQLPGLDGLALATQAHKLNPGLRIVMISGHASVLEDAMKRAIPKSRTLAKPFSIDQIRSVVRAALGG
jgi:two-component system, cell cycle response regulator CpdR